MRWTKKVTVADYTSLNFIKNEGENLILKIKICPYRVIGLFECFMVLGIDLRKNQAILDTSTNLHYNFPAFLAELKEKEDLDMLLPFVEMWQADKEESDYVLRICGKKSLTLTLPGRGLMTSQQRMEAAESVQNRLSIKELLLLADLRKLLHSGGWEKK